MQSSASIVEQYLVSLPADRRQIISTLRDKILKVLPKGLEEVMNWGMITYQVPLSVYPDTYNKQPLAFAGLASQKNYMSLYLMSVYIQPEKDQWLKEQFARSGKKLDMGKSCIRFKKLDDLAIEPILQIIKESDMAIFINNAQVARGNK